MMKIDLTILWKGLCCMLPFLILLGSCEYVIQQDPEDEEVFNNSISQFGCYGPFTENSTWLYRNISIFSNDVPPFNVDTTITDTAILLTRDTLINDTAYVIWGRNYIRVDVTKYFQIAGTDGTVDTLREYMYLDEELPVGATWESEKIKNSETGPFGSPAFTQLFFRIVDKGISVEVEDEIFEDVIVVARKQNTIIEEAVYEGFIETFNFYARGVGLIKREFRAPFILNDTYLINYSIEPE